MEFDEYQERAIETDRIAKYEEANFTESKLVVPLLGIAGEAGELLSAYKKNLRDGQADLSFKGRIIEELGDILWYVANTASKCNLSLNHIASENIEKCKDRWGKEILDDPVEHPIFDAEFSENEQLPRQLIIEVGEENNSNKVYVKHENNIIGNRLTDNSYHDDGYRFHDIFHFSYAAILGWSPVIRSLFNRKRRSQPHIDEIEDGGRAIAIEEGISALVFSHAQSHNYFEDVSMIDFNLIKTIKQMTDGLEVSVCSGYDWETSILEGYKVWREVKQKKYGLININLKTRSINCIKS